MAGADVFASFNLQVPTGVFFTFATVFFAFVYFICTRSNTSKRLPPCYAGVLPWIGCALEFGKSPLTFIEQIRLKLGPVFSLYLAGQRLTFITKPEDQTHFFNSEFVDFQKAVEIPVRNTASISAETFIKYHTKIHDTVRNCLSQSKLSPVCDDLAERFIHHGKVIWGHEAGEKKELFHLIQQHMYGAVMDNLFGNNILPTNTKEDLLEFSKFFIEFDDKFEYAAQVPPFFLKEWSKSKSWLLGKFFKVAGNVRNVLKLKEPMTVVEHLVQAVDKESAPNFCLLLLWASLANAIPITFWTVALILSHPDALCRVNAEIDGLFTTTARGDRLTLADISNLTYIKKCILEAIRLHSPGVIARKVIKDFTIREHTIPAGDLLMLSPYWSHKNEELFPEPESFNPDRWDKVDVSRNQFLDGFVAFGGGRYQCPGRYFALMEIQLYVATLMRTYSIEPLSSLPKQNTAHVVGTQVPIEPFYVNYNLNRTDL